MKSLSLLQRQCGECAACCTVVGVEELGKPANFRCEHRTCGGCGIYGKHPTSCKTYSCLWLEGVLDFDCRPDNLGIVFHCHEEDGFWLDGHMLSSAAPNMEKILALCNKLLAEHSFLRGVRLVCPDQVMNMVYPINLKKYPGGENDGRPGTLWATHDGKIYFLDAPPRKTDA